MRALVMSGGGNRIHLMLGAVERLYREHPYRIFCGTSSGAILAMSLASIGLDDTRDLLMKITNADVYKGRRWTTLFTALMGIGARRGIYDPSPILGVLERNWHPKRAEMYGSMLSVRAVGLHSGRSRVWRFGPGAVDKGIPRATLASSSIAPFFPAVIIDGDAYVDGGVRDFAGIGDAIDWNASAIDVIWSRPLSLERWAGDNRAGMDSTLRQIGILAFEVSLRDLEQAHRINREVEAGRTDKRHVPITIYAPTEGQYRNLPGTEDYLDFNRRNYGQMRRLGERMRRYSLPEAIEIARN